MPTLPDSEEPLVVRTDFSDAAAWAEIEKQIRKPVGPDAFRANVRFVDDRVFEGKTPDDLLAAVSEENEHAFLVIADGLAMTSPEHPLLVVDLVDDRGSSFRTVPSGVQAIENNLSNGNMEFSDFASAAELATDKLFRAF